MGLTAITLCIATLLVARSQRIIAAHASRHDDNARRARLRLRTIQQFQRARRH